MTIRPAHPSNASNDTTSMARHLSPRRATARWNCAFGFFHSTWQVISFSLMLTLLTACDRRPLEDYDYETARVRIEMDWESQFTEVPTGMTVMIFNDEGRQPVINLTNNIRSHTVSLREGTYRLLVFNQSFDEFGSMRFAQTDWHDSISVRATDIMTRQNAAWDEGIRYMREPEAIGSAVDTFTITKEMLTEGRSFRLHPRTRGIATLDDDGVWVLPEVVLPLVSELSIRVHIIGMHNMSSVTGSIDGMARGCLLTPAWRTSETGTLLLDNWTAPSYSEDDTEGWVVTSIPTFGLPRGKELVENRREDDNVIRLHFTLRDGSTKDFTFNVAHAIHYREDNITLVARTNVQIDLELVIEAPLFDDIVLPDVNPSTGSGGGFDAHVDPWDDGGVIDIGF